MNPLRPTVYLDHHASAPLSEAARTAITAHWDQGHGNPSSIHGAGQSARHALDRARRQIAEAVGALPRHVILTSGATEANHLAIRGVTASASGGTLWLSAMAHASVASAVTTVVKRRYKGGVWTQEALPVDPFGRIDLAAAQANIAAANGESQTTEAAPATLISLCLVSNELGTIQPVAALAEWLRDAHPDALLHVDASQALGRVDVDFSGWKLDLLTLSGHKIGAPSGIGALIARDGLSLSPLLAGSQEEGRRAGTENLLGAIALGAACANLAERRADQPRIRGLRDALWSAIERVHPAAVRHAQVPPEQETGTCLSVAFPGYTASDLVMALDVEGVAVSAGSACSSGLSSPSPVIRAILPESRRQLAAATLRISFGPENHAAELPLVIGALQRVLTRLAT